MARQYRGECHSSGSFSSPVFGGDVIFKVEEYDFCFVGIKTKHIVTRTTLSKSSERIKKFIGIEAKSLQDFYSDHTFLAHSHLGRSACALIIL